MNQNGRIWEDKTTVTAPLVSVPSCEYIQLAFAPGIDLDAAFSAFVQAYPDTADAEFEKHWCVCSSSICPQYVFTAMHRSTWFTQADVNALEDVGINTVRIPVSLILSRQ